MNTLLAGLALVVAVLTALAHRRNPPALDGERLFKANLATLLRGRAEAAGLDADDWAEQVHRFTLYHPYGRLPEIKLAAPNLAVAAIPEIPGEQALIEKLRRASDFETRFRILYRDEVIGCTARLEDPAELGTEYLPSLTLGVGSTFESVAACVTPEASCIKAITDSMPACWLLVPGGGGMGHAVIEELARLLGQSAVLVDEKRKLSEALNSHLNNRSDRLVIVASGQGIVQALEGLHASTNARDSLLGLVNLGGPCGQFDSEQYTHKAFDLEQMDPCPFFSLQWIDEEESSDEFVGAGGVGVEQARFGPPADDGGVENTILPVDLGLLPVDSELPLDLVARSLVLTVAHIVLSRR